MDDASFVRGFQGVGDLASNGQGFVYWDCPLRDALSQRRPLDQLEHQRPYAVLLFQAVDAGDVGMVQRGKDFGLTLEPGQALGVIREQVGQDFEGHIPAELRVPGAIHLAHAALADLGGDLIGAELGSGLNSHTRGNG